MVGVINGAVRLSVAGHGGVEVEMATAPYPRLVGDIGGTLRFGWVQDAGRASRRSMPLCDDQAGLDAVVSHICPPTGWQRPVGRDRHHRAGRRRRRRD
jgi:hypothetical protein